jgi:hypothetical protein
MSISLRIEETDSGWILRPRWSRRSAPASIVSRTSRASASLRALNARQRPEAHELAVQAVPWIIDQAVVIAHLAIGLAWRATREKVELGGVDGTEQLLVLGRAGQVAFDERRTPEVGPVGHACIGVMVRRSNDAHSGIRKALAESPGAAEEVYCGKRSLHGHAAS